MIALLLIWSTSASVLLIDLASTPELFVSLIALSTSAQCYVQHFPMYFYTNTLLRLLHPNPVKFPSVFTYFTLLYTSYVYIVLLLYLFSWLGGCVLQTVWYLYFFYCTSLGYCFLYMLLPTFLYSYPCCLTSLWYSITIYLDLLFLYSFLLIFFCFRYYINLFDIHRFSLY